MFLDQGNPILRQVKFILSPSLSYTFDVNNTIKILYLKKMISAAARLRKHSFRIYNNNIDYTEYDDSSLTTLFPDLQLVIFTIHRTEDEALYQEDTILKININLYCKDHSSKYLSYYCYTCNQSVCSLCILNNNHKGHNYIEKTDYLQSSKVLVNNAFKGNKVLSSKAHELLSKQNCIRNIIGDGLESVLFKPIYDTIKEIEVKLNDIVMKYNSLNKKSLEMFSDNLLMSQNYCVQGIDNLKESINVADIIVNENVFMIFDKAYRNLPNKIESIFTNDIHKYNVLNNELFESINQFIQTNYNDILSYLKEKLEVINTSQLLLKINENTIKAISSQVIIDSIIKDTNLIIKSSDDNNNNNNNNNSNSKAIDYNQNIQSLNQNNTSNNVDENINDFSYIMIPLKETNIIKVYRTDNSYETKYITFPKLLSINNFLQGCSHCNYNGILYISGGIYSNTNTNTNSSSNLFFSYNYNTNTFTSLESMLTSHVNHSMIGYKGYIYVIGGVNNKHCERYNIKSNKWTKLPTLNHEHVFPILGRNNNMLYVIFGKGSNGVIEAIDLNNVNEWEIKKFENEDVVEDVYGSAVTCIGDEIFCLGGVQKGMLIDKFFIVDLEGGALVKGEERLNFKEFFTENQLFYKDGCFYQISEKNYVLIQIKFKE